MDRILILLVMCLLLGIISWVAFGGDGALPESKSSSGITPDVTAYGDNKFYYLVDNRTDVVYLMYKSYNQCGISVMLNSDGTPITRAQLGLDYASISVLDGVSLPAG